jgi:hypothetical protein
MGAMKMGRMKNLYAILGVILALVASSRGQDSTAITYQPLGSGVAGSEHVSDRLYPYGFAVDYCKGTVNGSNDNSACLQAALNALGVNFQSLEIDPPVYSVSGTATVASSTSLTTGGTNFSMLAVGDVICIGSSTYVNCTGGVYRTITGSVANGVERARIP